MITEEEYNELRQQHEEGCKTSDYSKMVMMGSEKEKQMKEYEAEYICKHTSIEEIQGGQIERCRRCGKIWN